MYPAALDALNSLATTSFASVTGISIQQMTAYATQTVPTFAYGPFLFVYYNSQSVLSYAIIGGILMVGLVFLAFFNQSGGTRPARR
jgi:hypothetical protein